MRCIQLIIFVVMTLAAGEPAATFVFVGGGSGVVISDSGEVLTNHHVVATLCSPAHPALTVRLMDHGDVAAHLVGWDPLGDLALLRLDGRHPPLVPAVLAEDLPPAGSPVVAVGNPFGLGDLDDRPSVSRGVLAGGRVVRATYPDCLQHDAAVNPGNSGGPLFDTAGRLLGINGAIRSRTGFRVNSGIGLAISAPQIQRFLPALRSSGGGWVRRCAPPAGWELQPGTDGPVVSGAVPPTEAGDVLLTIDGRPCPSVRTALGLCAATPWSDGATTPVVLRRNGSEVTVQLPLTRAAIPGEPWHGLELEETAGGLAVTTVAADSPAAALGVVAGSLILTARDAVIVRRLDLQRACEGVGVGDPLTLRWRTPDGHERTGTCWLGTAR